MSTYESDESEGDIGEYQETTTLLGYATQDPRDDTISQLGGLPSWLDDTTAPSATLAKCRVCNGLMTLLLQLNGDLPSRFPGHERRLYLYGCRKKPCRRKDGCVRGIRGIRVAESKVKKTSKVSEVAEQKEMPNLGLAIFGGGPAPTSMNNPFAAANGASSLLGNPFSRRSNGTEQVTRETEPKKEAEIDLAQTFAEKARIGVAPSTYNAKPPDEPWPPESAFPRAYSGYALDAEYEALLKEDDVIPPSARVNMDIDGAGPSSSAVTENGREDKELFESSMDKTFQQFADRLAHNPEQVLRYEFDGAPLLYSSTDDVGRRLARPQSDQRGTGPDSKIIYSGPPRGMPVCNICGAKRVFELQLTPHAITMLEADEPLSAALDGMDWGTIVLGVCSADCTPSGLEPGKLGYAEEWVGVQWEDLK